MNEQRSASDKKGIHEVTQFHLEAVLEKPNMRQNDTS
jgi:hypothetical protein